MKKLLISFLVILISGISMMPAAGAVTLEAGENIVLTDSILDDVYILAGSATVEDDIFGDLYIAGGSVVINGNINEDLVIAGGKVTVLGNVFGDLRVMGGQVGIFGDVSDDIVVAAGQIDIGKGSVIGGSVISGAGLLTIDGQVKEDVRGGTGVFVLNGSVSGNVVLTVEDSMQISKEAKIEGDLKYSALIENDIPDRVVKGKVSFNQFERESVLQEVTYFFFIQKTLSFLGALLIALFFVFFMPKTLEKSGAIVKKNVLKSFGIGLLTTIASFIVPILLMITVIGIPIALIILAGLVIILYVEKVYVVAWILSYFFKFKKKYSKLKLFGWITLIILAYYLVGIIPFIGWLINVVLFFIGVGAIVMMEMEYFKALKTKNLI